MTMHDKKGLSMKRFFIFFIFNQITSLPYPVEIPFYSLFSKSGERS